MNKFLAAIITYLVISTSAYSAPSGEKTTASDGVKPATQFDIGKKFVSKAKKFEKSNKFKKAEKAYKKAINSLLKYNGIYPGDPDTLNLLGFTHRKIGDYENAEIYYSMGLEIDPKHIGINEYMGELFVVTNRIEKARERLAVLADCKCKEYDELKQVIEGTKQSKY